MANQPRPVALIADADSAIAGGIAEELTARGLQMVRATPDEGAGCIEAEATIFVLEQEPGLTGLRARLDRSSEPTLVVAATRRLAAAAVPMLHEARVDLATAADTADVIVWRLNRLIALADVETQGSADRDALTGLLNRHAFVARLEDAIASTAPGEVTGVLFLDLDQFKTLNDQLGHLAGDEALHAVGHFLPRRLAPGDTVARLGGDEFGCLLRRKDVESTVHDAQTLLGSIREVEIPTLPLEPSFRLSASAGLAFVREGASAVELLHEADIAAYDAKFHGRNQLKRYDQIAEAARGASRDLRLQHFENVTRVATERLVEMITLKSRRLVDAARREVDFCSLTGLYSRRYFDKQLAREMDLARSQGRTLTLALLDLDHFHSVNMTYGWPTGDRVLQAFAGVVQANVRSTDWIARYGGEEFVIVMPDTRLDSAGQVVERVRQSFAATLIDGVDGQQVAATLSAGIAQLDDGARTTEAFVNQASSALLRAKAAGRNVVAT